MLRADRPSLNNDNDDEWILLSLVSATNGFATMGTVVYFELSVLVDYLDYVRLLSTALKIREQYSTTRQYIIDWVASKLLLEYGIVD